jgi:hypothetical protein
MIAIPKKKRKRKVTAKHQELFATTMLPTIIRIARQNFSHLDPEAKEEATAEVVAAAFIMFVGLVRDGRASLAFPSVLGMYGVRRVRIGRSVADTFVFRIDVKSYAVGIFLCPAAGVKSTRRSRFTPNISNRPRHAIPLHPNPATRSSTPAYRDRE